MPEEISCREKILSNDYKDFLINVGEHTLLGLPGNVRSCIQEIVGKYRAIYVETVPGGIPLATLGYQTQPKLYTLMDSTNMDASGITRVRNQPFLDLSGRNTLIGLIDTGERVIIMSS